MTGFIRKFLLPREVDFNAALLAQARIGRAMVDVLHASCSREGMGGLDAIAEYAEQANALKNKNMQELLDVFITPYDKESIYRMITQLDWITLSVKHFVLETNVYDLHSIGKFKPVIAALADMAEALETGIAQLDAVQMSVVSRDVDRIRTQYDHVVSLCATETGIVLEQDDIKLVFKQKDQLRQLREIARRIHIAADTLADMAIKVV
ncbi:MAG: hypothetical protein PVF89_03730 [Lysobacterales bacterium]|jgi:hypothetical protein